SCFLIDVAPKLGQGVAHGLNETVSRRRSEYELRHHGGRREAGKLAGLPREVRLVGIAGLEGDACQPGPPDVARELDETLEAQDAIERLRAEAEGLMAVAAQRAFAEPGLRD